MKILFFFFLAVISNYLPSSPSGTEAIDVEVNSWPLRVVTITATELNVPCSLIHCYMVSS